MFRAVVYRDVTFASLMILLLATPAFGQRRGHDGGTSRGPSIRGPGNAGSGQGSSPSATFSQRHTGRHPGTFYAIAAEQVRSYPARYHHGHYARRYFYAPFAFGYYYAAYPYYIAPGYVMERYLTGFPDVGGAIGHPEAGLTSPPARDEVALILVQLPADADLWIDGVKMKPTGPRSRFTSPPLEPGVPYTYEIRAVWTENGRKVDQAQNLIVRAGNESSVTFVALPADAVAGDGLRKVAKPVVLAMRQGDPSLWFNRRWRPPSVCPEQTLLCGPIRARTNRWS